MDSSRFTLVFVGLGVNFLFGICALIIDRYFSATIGSGPLVHIAGSFAISTLAFSFLIFFVIKLARVTSWRFYVFIFPLFITSCLDTVVMMELLRGSWVMPNYIHPGDDLLESVWGQSIVFVDATLMHFLNFITLYNYYNGKLSRSLILFNSAIFGAANIGYLLSLLTMSGPISILNQCFYGFIPYLFAVPLWALRQPRSFTFKNGVTKSQKKLSVLDIVTIILMGTTGVIYIGKFLVSHGLGFGPLRIFEVTDPMILFEGIPGAIRVGVIHGWIGVLMIMPSMTFCEWHLAQGGKKPEFLWDLGIIQASVVVLTQAYSIIGSLNWEVPAEIRVECCNTLFWIVNVIPLIASSLFLYRLSEEKQNIVAAPAQSKNKKKNK